MMAAFTQMRSQVWTVWRVRKWGGVTMMATFTQMRPRVWMAGRVIVGGGGVMH